MLAKYGKFWIERSWAKTVFNIIGIEVVLSDNFRPIKNGASALAVSTRSVNILGSAIGMRICVEPIDFFSVFSKFVITTVLCGLKFGTQISAIQFYFITANHICLCPSIWASAISGFWCNFMNGQQFSWSWFRLEKPQIKFGKNYCPQWNVLWQWQRLIIYEI